MGREDASISHRRGSRGGRGGTTGLFIGSRLSETIGSRVSETKALKRTYRVSHFGQLRPNRLKHCSSLLQNCAHASQSIQDASAPASREKSSGVKTLVAKEESQELEDSQPLHQAFLEEAQPAIYESWAARFPQLEAAFVPAAQIYHHLSLSLSHSLSKR